MCMADKFPESLPAFQKMFPDDAACAEYLEAINCFRVGKCFKVVNNEPSTREPFCFHYDTRTADYWYTYEDDHDPGDEDVQR